MSNTGHTSVVKARIAVAGIHAEANPRHEVRTTRGDYRSLARDALLAHPDFAGLESHHPHLVGGLHLRAPSGGPTARADFETMLDELLSTLAGLGRLDGLLLATHGALAVDDVEDADGQWITAVRALVGARCRIVTVFDPHGTPTARCLSVLDGAVTYRTTPHVDELATKRRGLELIRTLLDAPGPTYLAWSGLPIRVPSERAASSVEPLRSVYPCLEANGAGVWSSDVFIGNGWAPLGRPTMGSFAVGSDEDRVRNHAERIAHQLWTGRRGFDYTIDHGDVAATLARVEDVERGPLVIADSGDNPGGGGTGDRTELLLALVHRECPSSLVAGVVAPRFVAACWAADDDALLKPDFDDGQDVGAFPAARVLRRSEVSTLAGRIAIVRMNHVTIVVVERRSALPDIDDLRALGVDPAAFHVVVVKAGFIPEAYLDDGRQPWLALTSGVTDHRSLRPMLAAPDVPIPRTMVIRRR